MPITQKEIAKRLIAQAQKIDDFPKDICDIMFLAHTHASHCQYDEIVYREKDVIKLLNYVARKYIYENQL